MSITSSFWIRSMMIILQMTCSYWSHESMPMSALEIQFIVARSGNWPRKTLAEIGG